MTLALK